MKTLALALAFTLAPPLIGAVTAQTDPQINWQELGTVGEQTTFYGEGAHFIHPSGVEYVRQGGNWVIYNGAPVEITGLNTAAVPEPSAWMLMGLGLAAIGLKLRRE